jgi:hypothetical protein
LVKEFLVSKEEVEKHAIDIGVMRFDGETGEENRTLRST